MTLMRRAYAYILFGASGVEIRFCVTSKMSAALALHGYHEKNPPKFAIVQIEGLWYPYYSYSFIALSSKCVISSEDRKGDQSTSNHAMLQC